MSRTPRDLVFEENDWWDHEHADDSKEDHLRAMAALLADARHGLYEEYLLRLAGGASSWDAERMAQAAHGKAVTMAEAEYEIAKARLT